MHLSTYQTIVYMKTALEISKIKAISLYILQESGGTLDLITLFKKMYFSQRLYLARYGKTIFNDSFRAKKRGPVPSFTYRSFTCAFNNMEGATRDIKEFDMSFMVHEEGGVRFISAHDKPDMKKIAKMEQKTIQEVLKWAKEKTPDELSEESHDSAWEIANKRAANDPTDDYISIVNMAKAGGASKEIINYIRQRQQMESYCAG